MNVNSIVQILWKYIYVAENIKMSSPAAITYLPISYH